MTLGTITMTMMGQRVELTIYNTCANTNTTACAPWTVVSSRPAGEISSDVIRDGFQGDLKVILDAECDQSNIEPDDEPVRKMQHSNAHHSIHTISKPKIDSLKNCPQSSQALLVNPGKEID